MAWRSELPVSKQIAEKLRLDILSKKFLPGSQFPTVRQLAIETSANPNTVQKALALLESEGLLEARGTVGRFVTNDENILTETKIKLQREYVDRILKEAETLGISKDALISYLKEGEN